MKWQLILVRHSADRVSDGTFYMILPLHTKANMIRNGTVTEAAEDEIILAASSGILKGANECRALIIMHSMHRDK